MISRPGGVAEWLNAPVLKTGRAARLSWVRILPPPPFHPAQVGVWAFAGALALVAGCSSVPGETTTVRAVQREVRDRVLSLARKAEPQCRQSDVTHTEVLDVYSDGRSSSELWSVQACGRRLNYVVSFPATKGPGFSVREER
jgi:hypothetical protein